MYSTALLIIIASIVPRMPLGIQKYIEHFATKKQLAKGCECYVLLSCPRQQEYVPKTLMAMQGAPEVCWPDSYSEGLTEEHRHKPLQWLIDRSKNDGSGITVLKYALYDGRPSPSWVEY